MGSTKIVMSQDLLHINVGLGATLGLLNPLLAQIDLALFGSLGLGAFQLDLQAQLSASLGVQLALTLPNPFASFQAALAAIAELQLSLELPNLSLQLSASLSFSAMLGLQIGGLDIALQAALAVKIPMVRLAAQMAAALNAGPVFALVFNDEPSQHVTLAQAGQQISSMFSAGLVDPDSGNLIAPNAPVYGILLVTSAPSAWAGIGAIMFVG